MRSTFKVLFYLKKNAPKKDGSVPVMCRITIDGTIAQFSCKCDILPNLWDVKSNRASGKSAVALETNRFLDKKGAFLRHNEQILSFIDLSFSFFAEIFQ